MDRQLSFLRITIQSLQDAHERWRVTAEVSGGQSLPTHREFWLSLDLDQLETYRHKPYHYGMLLGKALFRGTIGEALAEARAGDECVRILLSVEPPGLQRLFWERLCIKRGEGKNKRWVLLARDEDTPFSYLLATDNPATFVPPDPRSLRALVLVASPSDLTSWNLKPFDGPAMALAVLRGLSTAQVDLLAHLPEDHPPELGGRWIGPPTPEALIEALKSEQPYHLLHIVCHGEQISAAAPDEPLSPSEHAEDFDEDEEAEVDAALQSSTALYLADEANRTVLVKGDELLRRLRGVGRRLPHMVFLAACQSGAPDPNSLARSLVRELGIPAVLAMTELIEASAAEALSRAFYGALLTHGEVDRALVYACAQLPGPDDLTIPAIFSRLGGLALLRGVAEEGALRPGEVRKLRRLLTVQMALRAPAHADRVDRLLERLGPQVTPEARGEAEAELERICSMVFRRGLSPCHPRALLALPLLEPYASECPFPGLPPFDEASSRYFYRPRAQLEEILARLRQAPCLAVIGKSGSGKSSLVRAWLLPALAREAKGTLVHTMTPGAAPRRQLKAALDALDSHVGLGPTVLFIDQFEEVFTQCEHERERREFFQQLCRLVADRKHRLILTMRADFLIECAPYHKFVRLLRRYLHLLPPLAGDELREAVEHQAREASLSFDADLLNTLIDDIHGEPGAMPLLQQALRELYDQRYGYLLTTSEYRALGGVREAIARSAERLYATLDEADRTRLRTICVRLTRLDQEDRPNDLPRDTRGRARMADLVAAGDDLARVEALVRRFTDARLFVTGKHDERAERMVEFAHEALIDRWDTLRQWLKQSRPDQRLLARLRGDAADWEQRGKHEEWLLLSGDRLHQALTIFHEGVLAVTALERDYILACQARHEDDELQRQREALARWAEAQRQERAHLLVYSIRPDLEAGFSAQATWVPPSGGPERRIGGLVLPPDLVVRVLGAADPRAQGLALGEALFADGRFRLLWREALAQATPEQPLHLRLEFPGLGQRSFRDRDPLVGLSAATSMLRSASESIQSLPWELTRDPADGQPLARQGPIVISCYRKPDGSPARPEPLPLLVALLAVGDPDRVLPGRKPPFDPERELLGLPDLLREHGALPKERSARESTQPNDDLIGDLLYGHPLVVLACHFEPSSDGNDVRLFFGDERPLLARDLAVQIKGSRQRPLLLVIREPGGLMRPASHETRALLGEIFLRAGIGAVLVCAGPLRLCSSQYRRRDRRLSARPTLAGSSPWHRPTDHLPAVLRRLLADGHLGRALAARVAPDATPQTPPALFTTLDDLRLWLVPPPALRDAAAAPEVQERAVSPVPVVMTLQRTSLQGVEACVAAAEIQLEPGGAWVPLFGARQRAFPFDPWPALGPERSADRRGFSLSEALFGQPWFFAAYHAAHTLATARNTGLRLQIRLDRTDPVMTALPWELLADPFDEIGMISLLSNRFLFSRAMMDGLNPLVSAGEAWPAQGRGIVVALRNQGAGPGPEIAELRKVLRGWDLRVLSAQHERRPATPEAIAAALGDRSDLVYLHCEISYDQASGRPQLVLEDAEGRPALVELDVVARQLAAARPRLVVMYTRPAAGTALGPVELMAATGIPAVVGIDLRTAYDLGRRFVLRLFTELEAHGDIEQAVAAARAHLFSQLGSDFSMVPAPLLYLRSLVRSPLEEYYRPVTRERPTGTPSTAGAFPKEQPLLRIDAVTASRLALGKDYLSYPLGMLASAGEGNEELLTNGIDAETGQPLLRIDAVTASRIAQGNEGSEPKELVALYKAKRAAASAAHL